MVNFPLNRICYFEDGIISEFHHENMSKKNLLTLLSPKIGIVSYKNLVFIRKSYPKTIKKNLRRVIEKEIESIFQEQNYVYHYQIINETDSQIDLSIWAYDGRIKNELIKAGCSHIIPEPILYSFEKPSVMIYQTSDFYLIIFSMNNKILNFMTTKKLSKEIILLFFKGINNLKSIKCFAYLREEVNISKFFDEPIEIEKKVLPQAPLFLDFIQKAKIKNFRIRKFYWEKIEPCFLLRVIIYLLLALSLNFYMSNNAYDRKISEIDNEIKKLKYGGIESSDRTSINNKINEIRQKKQDIVYIIDTLSNLLPQGTIVRKININEENLEIFISTPEPLLVLNNLNFENCFASIKLASPIIKEEGKFSMELKIGLKKCRFQEKS